MKQSEKDILYEIKKRKISQLVHFTPGGNIYNILKYNGLHSRKRITDTKIKHTSITPDDLRLDGREDYICLSIQFPNQFLFSRFRNNNDGMWCVISIEPRVVANDSSLFSISNAASRFAKKTGIESGGNACRRLFQSRIKKDNLYGCKILDRKSLPNNYTTDVQAEVLVKDRIRIENFIKIYFRNKNEMLSIKESIKNQNKYNDIKYSNWENLFDVDESLWQERKNNGQ